MFSKDRKGAACELCFVVTSNGSWNSSCAEVAFFRGTNSIPLWKASKHTESILSPLLYRRRWPIKSAQAGPHYSVADTPHRISIPRRTSSIIEGNTSNWILTHRWSCWTFASSDLVISFFEPSARQTCVRTVLMLLLFPTT